MLVLVLLVHGQLKSKKKRERSQISKKCWSFFSSAAARRSCSCSAAAAAAVASSASPCSFYSSFAFASAVASRASLYLSSSLSVTKSSSTGARPAGAAAAASTSGKVPPAPRVSSSGSLWCRGCLCPPPESSAVVSRTSNGSFKAAPGPGTCVGRGSPGGWRFIVLVSSRRNETDTEEKWRRQ